MELTSPNSHLLFILSILYLVCISSVFILQCRWSCPRFYVKTSHQCIIYIWQISVIVSVWRSVSLCPCLFVSKYQQKLLNAVVQEQCVGGGCVVKGGWETWRTQLLGVWNGTKRRKEIAAWQSKANHTQFLKCCNVEIQYDPLFMPSTGFIEFSKGITMKSLPYFIVRFNELIVHCCCDNNNINNNNDIIIIIMGLEWPCPVQLSIFDVCFYRAFAWFFLNRPTGPLVTPLVFIFCF